MKPDDVQLLVLAKEPVPGRVKTRLCPPCTPHDAAAIARASLEATLAAVTATPARRRVLVLDGSPTGVSTDIDVIVQRGAGLDERLASAFEDAGGPSVLVGMDAPQITPGLLRAAMEALASPGTDAVLGPSADGGYWSIGLRSHRADAFIGVPMSTTETYDRQEERLRSLGLEVGILPTLDDVDRFEDAMAVARRLPGSRFAAAVESVAAQLEGIA